MRKVHREILTYVSLLAWPILLLNQVGVRDTFEELLKRDFWISVGYILLITIASVGMIAGCFYGYYRFCRWFNRAIEGQRSRVAERIAFRQGVLAWSTSDPLHDPELDG